MTQDKAITHWIHGAAESWKTAKHLIKGKRNDHALFFVYLTIEKILKAVYTARNSQPSPYIHNLSKLVKDAGVAVTANEIQQLDEITRFNVAARYDDFKFQLYKKATAEYTRTWFEIAEKLYQKYLKLV